MPHCASSVLLQQQKHIYSAQCALVNFRAVGAAASALPDLEHAPTAK